MKRLIIEQDTGEFYTSTSGIALIGAALKQFTTLAESLGKAVPLTHGVSHGEVITSYCALLAQGKSDFVAIEQHREDDFFRQVLGLSKVPSEPTLRQRMDDHAAAFLPAVSWASVEFLKKAEVPLTALPTGHVAVDIDAFAMDNSGTKKEFVSRTYRNFDGYQALPVYLANEGWLVDCSLLPGSRHPQKVFVPTLQRALAKIRHICKDQLLVRSDSAHDAMANLVELSRHDGVDYIIKWNPRKQDREGWKLLAFSEKRKVQTPRPGKRVATFSVIERHTSVDENGEEVEHAFRRVMCVTERTIDKKGQPLLVADIELEGVVDQPGAGG